MNLYAYCGNNPVMYTDPYGEFFGIAIEVNIFFEDGGVFVIPESVGAVPEVPTIPGIDIVPPVIPEVMSPDSIQEIKEQKA